MTTPAYAYTIHPENNSPIQQQSVACSVMYAARIRSFLYQHPSAQTIFP